MPVKTCECCGHPVPDDAALASLSVRQQQFVKIISAAGRRGLSGAELGRKLSRGQTSQKLLHVMRFQTRERLAAAGLRIVAQKGPGALWRLEKIDA
jgi:hypothetical protein